MNTAYTEEEGIRPGSANEPPSGLGKKLVEAMPATAIVCLGLGGTMALQRLGLGESPAMFALLAAGLAAAAGLALEVSFRRHRRLTAQLSALFLVLMLSALFLWIEKKVITYLPQAPEAITAVVLTNAVTGAVLWRYRLPLISALLALGLSLLIYNLLVMAQTGGSVLWSWVYVHSPLLLGGLHLALATTLDWRRPQLRGHALWLHLIGLGMLQWSLLKLIPMHNLPLWLLPLPQLTLIPLAWWLRRSGLVALLIVLALAQALLVWGPAIRHQPVGWDMLLTGLGLSLLLGYGLWSAAQRRGNLAGDSNKLPPAN
ncbi:MAG: hypothetical protein ACKOCZ_00875 [Betaproteobacteria bacterium]